MKKCHLVGGGNTSLTGQNTSGGHTEYGNINKSFLSIKSF